MKISLIRIALVLLCAAIDGAKSSSDVLDESVAEDGDEILWNNIDEEALEQTKAAIQLESGEKRTVQDLSTKPLRSKEELEVVATLDHVPGNVELQLSTERMFFTLHPEGQPPEDLKLCEWNRTSNRYQAYPSAEFQNELATPLALRVDNIRGWLLVLDSKNHGSSPPQLFVIELESNKIVRRFTFPKEIAGIGSALHDFVIGPRSRFLYISDASMQGADPGIIVLDLHVWRAKRVLSSHPSVQPKPNVPVVNGKPFELPWKVGVDSISLDETGTLLYFAPNFEDILYSVPTKPLERADSLRDRIGGLVVPAGKKTVSEGIAVDKGTGKIYLTDFEHSSIAVIDPSNAWELRTLVKDPELLRWPDGISIANGYLYITCSAFDKIVDGTISKAAPFHILRISLSKPPKHEL